jgi:16S rRNA (guanine527-N7)-methyltransferase
MMTWQEDLSSAFTLSTSQISALEGLLKLLVGISDRNLTAVTGEEKIINVHFRDSLSLLAFSELGSASDVVDIGSGAGFPGLPLAIALPDKSFTLLESNAKRCKFLTSAAVQLQLDNVRILAMRAEVAGRSDLRDSSDLALARAVGPLPVVLEYSLPLLKPGGAAL